MRTLLHILWLALAMTLGGAAVADGHGAAGTHEAGTLETPSEQIEVPDLPFPDNPDPEACGIPQRFGSDDAAWLDGRWQGELIQPTVFFYDSHLRREVRGMLPTGSEVRVVLFQDNPVLNYYLVEGTAADGTTQRGWVPAPFVVFEAAPEAPIRVR